MNKLEQFVLNILHMTMEEAEAALNQIIEAASSGTVNPEAFWEKFLGQS